MLSRQNGPPLLFFFFFFSEHVDVQISPHTSSLEVFVRFWTDWEHFLEQTVRFQLLLGFLNTSREETFSVGMKSKEDYFHFWRAKPIKEKCMKALSFLCFSLWTSSSFCMNKVCTLDICSQPSVWVTQSCKFLLLHHILFYFCSSFTPKQPELPEYKVILPTLRPKTTLTLDGSEKPHFSARSLPQVLYDI